MLSDAVASTLTALASFRTRYFSFSLPGLDKQILAIALHRSSLLLTVGAMSKRRRTGFDELRWQSVLHKGGISIAGLADTMATLQLDEASAAETLRKQILKANHAKLHDLKCCVELPLASGGSWRWDFLDPCKLLAALVESSPALQALYAQAWERYPSGPQSPWSLVVGYDEFQPGNKLATDQTRKTMVLSFSFLQLGQAPLSRGSTWCTPVCVRSNQISEVATLASC